MRYFDLHCDTITECFLHEYSLAENSLHVDLKRGDAFDTYVQCYAVWMPDELHGEEAFQRFCQVADKFSGEIRKNHDQIAQACVAGDWNRAEASGKQCAVLSVENASALGGRLENVSQLAKRGVKLCTLTWNGENELGRGAGAPGTSGLSEFGRLAVAELENQGIIIDLSHASPELFYDTVHLAKKPVVATHSNSYDVCPHPRNLTDDQFKIIRDMGGLVGLNFYKGFLHQDPEKASLEDILRHARHFLELGGENTLAIGADWDGASLVTEGLQTIPVLYQMFTEEFGRALTDRIFYSNGADFFKNRNLL